MLFDVGLMEVLMGTSVSMLYRTHTNPSKKTEDNYIINSRGGGLGYWININTFTSVYLQKYCKLDTDPNPNLKQPMLNK